MNSNINDRLKQLRKELKLTQEALAQRFGIGKSALSMIETGKAALSQRNRNILVQGLNVNPEWLDHGIGEMFNAPPDYRSFQVPDENTVPFQSVPLYSLDNSGGFAALLNDRSGFKPVDFIHIPNLPRCDGAIYLSGDGMYPLLKSGDVILYKRVNDIGDIFWGDMYLLSVDVGGEEYVTVRYVNKSEHPGCVKLSGFDSRHADKDIDTSKIQGIALIKASIRMNSII